MKGEGREEPYRKEEMAVRCQGRKGGTMQTMQGEGEEEPNRKR